MATASPPKARPIQTRLSPPVLVPLALPPVLVLPVPGWDADWQAFL